MVRGPAAGAAKPIIFVVEDSAVHAKFLQEALSKASNPPQVRLFRDAETAWPVISDLQRQPRDAWPRLALIDIELPNASGIELLARIRRSPAFADWPVAILTSSRHKDDVAAARTANASAYFEKPIDVAGWQKLARDIVELWMPIGAP